jgi:hypothetical protein
MRCRGPWLVAALLAACSGQIRSQGEAARGLEAGGPGSDGSDGSGSPRAASPTDGRSPNSPGDPGTGQGEDDGRVGRVGIHRLNNLEYDFTVRDLLGVSSTPARGFIADAKAAGFDNIASALGMTAAQYEQYFQAADAIVEQVWSDDALRSRVLPCGPGDGEPCAERALRELGLRAYRHPLSDDELQRLLAVVAEAQALGEPFDRGVAQAVKAMLASPSFLYRVELDPDPASPQPHPLGPYELASRLSYLLWSTLPDRRLFELAADGSITEDATLLAQIDRMLDDPRADRFVESFAGQWLGMRALSSHQVDPTVFPGWSDGLRDAMVAEGLAYFDEFLHGTRGMDTFFTADVNFVDDRLAQLYGFDGANVAGGAAVGAGVQPHTETDDARRGFLGLASFLTLSSFSYRTAPTLRGKWVLENLLCTEIPPPPADVPQLDDAMADPADLASQNVRVRLAAHRTDPTCAGCHRILDPIGLGLERFDGIGAYRERYDNGDTIDASGELPDGATFDGLHSLSQLLAEDPRLLDCTAEKLLTYALGRTLTPGDRPQVEAITQGWREDGLGLWALIERIVLSDLFRMRRGESET